MKWNVLVICNVVDRKKVNNFAKPGFLGLKLSEHSQLNRHFLKLQCVCLPIFAKQFGMYSRIVSVRRTPIDVFLQPGQRKSFVFTNFLKNFSRWTSPSF